MSSGQIEPHQESLSRPMTTAMADFRRSMKWILIVGVMMVAAAQSYLAATGDLDLHLIIATTLGVFLSVLLGCGLFAAAFFSNKSGHDQLVSDATTPSDGSGD